MSAFRETAFAKLNLALHVRGRMGDGRHRLETLFAFCLDGDRLSGEPAQALSLELSGPFAPDLEGAVNLVLRAAEALRQSAGTGQGAALRLDKRLPVASGLGGGSADAAAALRLLTALWRIDPAHAARVAPTLGADVPPCLLSMTARGTDAGDTLELVVDPDIASSPVLMVNPRVALSTKTVFERWDGIDRGPLESWRDGRNDLEAPARSIVPEIGEMLAWLAAQEGAAHARMSGSGATCFALFADEEARDRAAAACPPGWWHLATHLR